MFKIRNFKDLQVWQKSMSLVEIVYVTTKSFPQEEKYGLVSQMRRSAVSIPSNISEGHGRNSNGEFRQFLGIACGSVSELETQVELAIRLGYLEQSSPLPERCIEVGRMLNGLIRSLKIE